VGGAVVAVTWSEAKRPGLTAWERTVFDAVNRLPEAFRATWPIMQLGSFGAIPALTFATDRLTHDRRLAVGVGTAGLAAYLGAKVVKRQVGRGRPADLHEDPILRENARGLGYPSGHSAEAAAMATVLATQLPRSWRWAPSAVAAVVGLSRLHVGAHLPHDVFGGAALGVAIGGAVNLTITRRP
jgi:glycosyltransferase 2 family protein